MDFHQASLLETNVTNVKTGKAALGLNEAFSSASAAGTPLETEFQLEADRVLTLLTYPVAGNKKPT